MNVQKIFGPPGTGKTTRLLDIMEEELRHVEPERLAYMTFTVAARAEAKERALSRFNFLPERLKWFRTLHATAFELLGTSSRGIVDGDALARMGDVLGYDFGRTGYTQEGLPQFGFETGDRLLAFDHFRRHRLEDVKTGWIRWDDEVRIKYREAEFFSNGYARWRQQEGLLDFTDLLERGGAPLPCDVVILDEAQDLSPLQWRVFWQFAANAERVYIAGDDDQAIYEWAGASPKAFLEQPGSIEVLPKSHRCPRRVTNLAEQIVRPITLRQPKTWTARDAEGELRYALRLDELPVPATGSVLYLVRNRKYMSAVLDYLKWEGEPHVKDGAPTIDAELAGAIIAWERLRKHRTITSDQLELVFTWTSPKHITLEQRANARSLESTELTVEMLDAANAIPATLLGAPWYWLLDRAKTDEMYIRKVIEKYGAGGLTQLPRIRVTTIHGAKGAEADSVVLLTEMANMVLRGMERDPDAERRVWYVGVTRAKESLTVCGPVHPWLL